MQPEKRRVMKGQKGRCLVGQISKMHVVTCKVRTTKNHRCILGRDLRICKDTLSEFYKCKAFAVSRLFVPGQMALIDWAKLLKKLPQGRNVRKALESCHSPSAILISHRIEMYCTACPQPQKRTMHMQAHRKSCCGETSLKICCTVQMPIAKQENGNTSQRCGEVWMGTKIVNGSSILEIAQHDMLTGNEVATSNCNE